MLQKTPQKGYKSGPSFSTLVTKKLELVRSEVLLEHVQNSLLNDWQGFWRCKISPQDEKHIKTP